MGSYITQLTGLALGALGIIGATVAVCLGKIDAPTYIGIVGPVLGIGVGAGVHASGVNTVTTNGAAVAAVKPVPLAPTTLVGQ